MTMMLPLGIHLTWRLGIFGFDASVMALIWGVCFAWLAWVVYLHFGKGERTKRTLTSIDYWYRLLAVVALVGTGGVAATSDILTMPGWVAAKLIIFGVMIACGFAVRIKLREFGPAFANLAQGNPSDADNVAIRRSLGGTRPFVITIWIGLLASTALGLRLF